MPLNRYLSNSNRFKIFSRFYNEYMVLEAYNTKTGNGSYEHVDFIMSLVPGSWNYCSAIFFLSIVQFCFTASKLSILWYLLELIQTH